MGRGVVRVRSNAACCVYTCRRLIDLCLIAGAELPPHEGVTARNKRRRTRYFAVCENCAEEAPHTAEEGAEVGLCLLCHRMRPREDIGGAEEIAGM